MSTALTGKVAIVTGAARGLGEAYATRLAAEGLHVVAVDMQPGVHDLAARIGVTPVVADISTAEGVAASLAAAVETHGGVDVLVNNAGRWKQTPCDGDDRAQALADFHDIFDSNVRGLFQMTHAVVPSMIERGGGHIVNISTYYVLPPRPAESLGTNPPGTDLYNASKWALNGFTQSWALTLRKHGIRVNALAMGATDAPMLRNLFKLRGIDPPPADVVAQWMTTAEQSQLLVDLLAEGRDGRSGEVIGSWVGHPVELPPRRQRGELMI
jgi:NAD(P)-dependent dehydrogenase (short-subunit alcohol dehydrogenase family)